MPQRTPGPFRKLDAIAVLAGSIVTGPLITGHSNRQAAAELYISVKTVEFHLGHIFAKLGIRSRNDLITRIAVPSPARTTTGVKPRDRPWRHGFSGRATMTG